MFKSLIVAGSLALSALALAPAAEARTSVGVYFGVPFYDTRMGDGWRYYDGYGWYDYGRYGDFDRHHRRSSSNFTLYFGIPFYDYRVGPGWRYYDGYGWYNYRRYGDFRRHMRHRLSCYDARRLVDRSGYDRVRVIECEGRTYTFRALRNGHRVTVYVNSRTGDIWR